MYKKTMKNKILHNTLLKRKIFALFVICLFAQSYAVAQTMARYGVVRTTGNSYSSIMSSGSAIPSWRYTAGGVYNLDDNRSYQVDIGFDFYYRGVRYTQFSVSTNGYMDLSSSTADGGPTTGAYGYQNTAFTNNTAGTLTAIAPFYDDLTTQGSTDPLGESIKYDLSGVEPNRVLTVEWQNMAVYGNTTPSLNFQVKLYESTGIIDINYSTMTQGTHGFSYTVGINGPTQSGTATASEVSIQQNTTTFAFGNGEINNLTTMPVSGSRITFTPLTMNAQYNFSITGITQSAMTLNWTDTLWNEVGFAVYRSDDGGATYNFITQTAANATSANMTGLLAGTTYYYKVYAVNEGRLSTALTGNATTSAAGSPYSLTSGSWKNPATWSTGIVPGISDNATIADGTTITIDSTVTVNSLTIGQGTSGTLLIGDNTTARSISVIGNIDIKSGGIFRVNGASNSSAHSITLSGDILNAGRFSLATDADSRSMITFNKNGTQTISGSGDSTHFYLMTVNMGSSKNNILDIFANNFSVSGTNFLTLTNGTFNLATGAIITPFTANTTISSTAGIRVNHSGAVFNTTGGNITVSGDFRVSNGNVNIGNNTNQNLVSDGGVFIFSGGTTKVRGRFEPANAYVITDFTMSSGTLIVADSGSTSTTLAPFTINGSGSRYVVSGGTIIIKKEGGSGAEDLGFINNSYTNYTVTGGTLQIGQTGLTPAAQVMRINTTIPITNLVVNSSNATATLITSSITVQNNVDITLGTLNANALDMTVGGNWTNASQTFTPSTGRVTFNGTGTQTITDAAGETFNKLIINKSSGSVSLTNNVTVSDSFQLTSGTFAVNSATLTLNGVVTAGGTLTSGTSGTVNYNRSSAGQMVLETNYGNLTFSNFTKTLPSSTIGIAGTFTSGTAAGHTVTGNTIDYNGAGAQNIASFQYNNLVLSNSGIKTQQSGADTVLGTLSVGASNTFTISSDTLRVFGDVTNAGTFDGTNYIELRGSSTQNVSGGGSFANLKINNSNGITLTGNTTINGTLRLLTGVITNSTDTINISSSGSVSRNSGHVTGWLKKYVPTGSSVSVTYEIGTSANYTSAVFVFGTVTSAGTLTVQTVNSEHPDIATSFINIADGVNRYWETRHANLAYNTGTGYDLTLTYVAGDCDIAGSANFRMNWYNGAFWDSTTSGTNSATTNQATGIDSLGVYAVGLRDAANAFRTKNSGTWNDFATVWERYDGTDWVAASSSPVLASGQITIRSGHTVTVTTNLSGVTNGQDQVLIEAGGTLVVGTGGTLQIRNGAGTDITVYGTLKWDLGTLSANGGPSASIMSGGRYIHDVNGSALMGGIATTWNANSTVEITGTTATKPTNLNQTFGNFVWNCTAQSANISFATTVPTVNGNFEVYSTNASQLQLTTTTTTLTVAKNFIVTGGNVVLITGAANLTMNGIDTLNVSGGNLIFRTNASNGTITMNVANAFILSNGTVDMSQRADVGSFGTINLSGDLRLTGGTLTETGTAYGQITLNGTSIQSYSSGSTISNDIRYTVNSSAILSLGESVVSGNQFTLSSGATLMIGSTGGVASSGATGNVQTTTRTYNSGANYIYNGTSAQVLGAFTTTATARTVNKLEINNTAGVSFSDSLTVTDSLKMITGNLAIGSYTLYIPNIAYLEDGTFTSNANGTVNYNKGSNGQIIIPGSYGNLILSNFNKTFPASTLNIAGTFTPGTATGHTVTGNTIDFNGTSTQTVNGLGYYNNLSISGSNWKTLDGNATVNGNLSISGATLSDSIYTLTVKGNIANSSLNTSSGSGKTILTSGSAAHAISGGGTFRILELNDAYGATTNANITIDSLLILANGILTANTNTIICNSATGITRTFGHVNGLIRKSIEVNGTPQTYTFQIGDAMNYTPVVITFQSVSVGGMLTVNQTVPDHPQLKFSGLDENKSVNRYYVLTGSGITFTNYDATFNFVSSDLDVGANTAYFFVKKYNGSWSPSTINLRNSTSTKTTGITGFGDFGIGEANNTFYWTKGAGTYNWGDDYNWSSHSVPTAGNNIVFDGKDTVEVNVDGICNNLTIHNDTLRLTMLAGKTLSVNGNLTQYSGIFSTRGSFPTVSGSVSLMNGSTFGYDSSGGTQTISAQSYRNLRISGGGTKTAAGVFTVNRNLTIGSGATFADGGFTITVKDSLTVHGSHTGSGKILFDGTTQHQLTGSGSLTNLQLNNSSGGINLDSNITVNGTLTLTSGIITASNDTLYVSSTGSISRTSGHINGNLRKYFTPAGDSLTLEIGTAASYLPVTVSFGTISTGGNLTVRMVATDHPDIVNAGVYADSTINRYWVINNNGIAFDTYNATFNWLPADVDAGISNFSDMLVVKLDNSMWNDATVGTITSTSVRAMSLTSFSSFAVGKGSSDDFVSIATGNWSVPATWDVNKIPKKRDRVTIVSPHVVTLVDSREVDKVTINSGGELADGGNTLDLYGNFSFSGKWSGSGTIRWNDSNEDTLSGSGGKATGTSTLLIYGTGKLITATNDTLYRVQIGTGNTITNKGTIQVTQVVGDASNSTWINEAGSTLRVSDALLSTGTLTATATNNTVSFNGGGAQTIPAFLYYNLNTATGGTKTAGGTLRVHGDLTIGASSTLNTAATTDTVYGNWNNSGTFSAGTSTIVFAGSPATTITGVTTFNSIVTNKIDSATAINLGSNIEVANLTMTNGTMQTGANAVTITNTRTGSGIIIGTVTRTHSFVLSTSYAFEGPYSTITFTAGTTPSSVTMTVAQSLPSSPTFVAVNRAVNISITGGSGLTSTLRLHYENLEANSLNETIMKLWRNSSLWNNIGSTSYDSVLNYIEQTGITTLSGNWGIGTSASSKSVSDINGGIANAGDSLLYTITIINPYNVTKPTIVVSDPLDDNLILIAGTISNSGNIVGQFNNGNGSMVGGTISWPSFSLASGASTARTFYANSDSLMDVIEAIDNNAEIDFGGSNNENVSTSISITNIANITIDTNIVSNQNPVPGDTLIYTLKYSNNGTSNANSVLATYTIPGNTTFLVNGYGALSGVEVNSVAKTNASDGDEVTVSGSNITVTIPTLSPGLYKQVRFKTIVN